MSAPDTTVGLFQFTEGSWHQVGCEMTLESAERYIEQLAERRYLAVDATGKRLAASRPSDLTSRRIPKLAPKIHDDPYWVGVGERLHRDRSRQGLPPSIEDEAALRRLASLFVDAAERTKREGK